MALRARNAFSWLLAKFRDFGPPEPRTREKTRGRKRKKCRCAKNISIRSNMLNALYDFALIVVMSNAGEGGEKRKIMASEADIKPFYE